MTFDVAPDSSPAWSPDGKWIAFVRATPEKRNRIMKIEVATGQESEVVTLRSGFSVRARSVDWPPDGHIGRANLHDLGSQHHIGRQVEAQVRSTRKVPRHAGGGQVAIAI